MSSLLLADNKSVLSYASGKVILIGEHAVVYGEKAIGVPIELGVRVAIQKLPGPIQGPVLQGIGPNFSGLVDKNRQNSAASKVLTYLAEEFGDRIRNTQIFVEGNLSPGMGLGSSAALCVALIKGIYGVLEEKLPANLLTAHVKKLETIFHGMPSGIDQNIIIQSTPILFQKCPQNQDIVQPIKIKRPISLVVATSGPHMGTKNAVASVANRYQRHRQLYIKIFEQIGFLVEEMHKALLKGEHHTVGTIMNLAQGQLNAIGVSTPQVESICSIAKANGALGAKLTGAGGGGAVICLVESNGKDLQKVFTDKGISSFITCVGQNNEVNNEY